MDSEEGPARNETPRSLRTESVTNEFVALLRTYWVDIEGFIFKRYEAASGPMPCVEELAESRTRSSSPSLAKIIARRFGGSRSSQGSSSSGRPVTPEKPQLRQVLPRFVGALRRYVLASEPLHFTQAATKSSSPRTGPPGSLSEPSVGLLSSDSDSRGSPSSILAPSSSATDIPELKSLLEPDSLTPRTVVRLRKANRRKKLPPKSPRETARRSSSDQDPFILSPHLKEYIAMRVRMEVAERVKEIEHSIRREAVPLTSGIPSSEATPDL